MPNLKKTIWETEEYYHSIADKEDFSHPAFLQVVAYTKDADTILDVGGGDGSKLSRLGNKKTKRTVVEVSSQAVLVGKQKFPNIDFVLAKNERLPFPANKFSAVTCFFVLEHISNPERLVSEIIRVTTSKGKFFLLAPNFGAPNRASPNFIGNRWRKLYQGFIKDFGSAPTLSWHKVTPKISSITEFRMDLDTTVEPYLNSLVKWLPERDVTILVADSNWPMELRPVRPVQKLFRFLGELNIYPFKYWGPHLFLIGEKL